MAEQKVVICPYCGDAQALAERCRACGGLFEPLSRQATHNAMGPWFVRDADRPFQPGCSYETLLRLIERGRVTKFTIVRGPTTRQFWTIAKHVPGLSHLLGYCHQCDASVDSGDHSCHACGAPFGAYLDRNYLGLPEIRPLPWEADTQEEIRGVARERLRMWRNPGDGDEPRTISSFASDAELLGTGEHAGGGSLPPSFGGGAGGTGGAGGVGADGGEAEGAVATAMAEAASLAPVTASRQADSHEQTLSRRVTQQRRTIRMLAAGGVVLGLFVLALSLSWMNAMFAPAVEPESAEPPAIQPGGDPTVDPDTAGERGGGPGDPALRADDDLPPNPEQLAGYERAIGLMEGAADEQRELSDRIADYTKALDLLKAIARDVDRNHWPADLQERLDTAQTQLDRLRLREFFP